MSKDLIFGKDARERLKAGVDKVANATSVTMGAKGRTVIVETQYGPMTTKDGVSVARSITLKDKVENQGANLIKEASSKTNDIAGDGTTATCVLAQAIYNEAYKRVSAGEDAIKLKGEIEEATTKLLESLKGMAKPVDSKETLAKITSISANNKEIGNFVADVLWETGKDGVITVEEGTQGIQIETVKGLQIDSGYMSPMTITDGAKMESVVDSPRVLVTDRALTGAMDIVPLMNKMMQAGENKLFILAEDIRGSALTTAIINFMQGKFFIVPIKVGGIGSQQMDTLNDTALITGAKLITKEANQKWDEITLDQLGSAKKVIAGRSRTIVIDGAGDTAKLAEYEGILNESIEHAKLESDRAYIKRRLAKLAGGIGLISVGGATESEMREKKQRVEDAVCAGKAAMRAGYVVGGGAAILEAAEVMKLSLEGAKCLHVAIEAPMRKIATNAGKNGDVVIDHWDDKHLGFNAVTGAMEDLEAAGILDPLEVVTASLEHGSSVACLLLSTECVITEEVEEKKV